MTFLADLHIHSRYSRATSRDLSPEHLAFWAMKKGIQVLGSGDITHPEWFGELREKLVESESGLFVLRKDFQDSVDARVPPSCREKPRFLLSGEISCI